MISWYKLLPVAKIMYDSLVNIINASTDKSESGRISVSEIEVVLKSQVSLISGTLGPGIVKND